MLSQSDLSLLYQIISDNSQTFEKISESFQQNFKKENHAKVGITILFLLKDNLLNIHQRIISYYILYEITKNIKIEANPYIPIILERLQKTQNRYEQKFLVDFLNNEINYIDLTVISYLKHDIKGLKINLNQIKMKYKQYINILNNKSSDKIRPVIYNINKRDINNLDNNTNINILNNGIRDGHIENKINISQFNLNYMSYYPTNNNFINEEPIWLFPLLKHNFIWEEENNNK